MNTVLLRQIDSQWIISGGRVRLAILQRRAFSVVGPSAWNDLLFELRSMLKAHPSKFYMHISLKFFFFVRDWAGSVCE